MRRVIVMCLAAVVLTAGLGNAADLRYMGSGPWQDVQNVGGIVDHGWQNPLLTVPGILDNARANWGGSTITIAYAAPNVKGLQAGVDESGIFQVDAGGSITAGNSTIGNNNFCTGTLIINTGGVVNGTNWFKVGGGNGGVKNTIYGPTTGILEVNGGTLNLTSHLWTACGTANASSGGAPTCLATININAGGIINVGGNIGLGTIDAGLQATGLGTATINVNGGLLNLYQWTDWNPATNRGSIHPGSAINIKFGRVVINGNKVAAANAYVALGRIKAFDGAGTVNAVYNSATNKTTITGISPMQPSPAYGSTVPEGTIALGWTNIDPNFPGDDVYVDVWFGTDNTLVTPADPNLPPYYVDFDKVVVGQNTTTVNVDAPVVGTAPTKYYWRVDSYIYGAAHIGDPNFPVVTGDLFQFDVTNDFPPTVTIETADTVTWLNQPVQLNATVSDTGTSALSIIWSSNPAGAVFSPSANVEDPVVTVASAAGEVTLTCSVSDAFNPQINTDTMILNVAADACDAAGIAGVAANYPMDIAEPFCVINIADLAALGLDWLVDYALTEPALIP